MSTYTQTPRKIALYGGWKVHTAAATVLLQDPYRHHLVAGRAGTPDVYVLPPAMGAPGVTLGQGVPVGTVINVHNLNGGGYAVTVKNSAATTIGSVSANKSSQFVLMANATAAGTWLTLAADKSNGRGPTQPDGYRFVLNVRRSQNNVHLLQAAVDDGYDGTVPALVFVRVFPNVVLGSPSRLVAAFNFGGDVAIDGVNWHASSKLILRQQGVISGKGGAGGGGGIGGTGASAGINGEDGGLGMRVPFSASIDNTGVIQGGGGGGGGGDGSAGTPGLHGGGGGGGAGADVDAANVTHGGPPGSHATGTGVVLEGSLYLGSSFGLGSYVSPNTGGHGGDGGVAAGTGGRGQTLNNGPDSSYGGVGGAAISRSSGATITWLTSGTVIGSTVVA